MVVLRAWLYAGGKHKATIKNNCPATCIKPYVGCHGGGAI